jgi:uncharacterized protein YigE (DUF2233 family)
MRPLLFLFSFAICACAPQAKAPAAPPSPCREQAFEGSYFTVCDPGEGRITLVAAGPRDAPLRDFAEVGRRIGTRRVAFAMNAGMFDDRGRPIGLSIVDGREVHAINRRDGGGNFHLMPNGVFLVRMSGRAEVVTTDRYRPATDIRLATQSGPMLVIGGQLHPRFDRDGESRYIRNGVGVRNGKGLFVISEGAVSFGKFARFFRDGLKTPDALFLDGSVSSLWDPASGRQDSFTPIGPMIVVLKPAESKPGRAAPATP